MIMDLRLLEYFLMVVETGNVSKAAQKLNLTQPTLTRQLQQLEEIYGSQLLIRGSRHITLTSSGVILKKRAQEILELQKKTKEEIKKNEHEITGEITIGCGESKGTQFLPILLNEFHQRYPNITFNICTGGSDESKEKINEGLIDIAIVLEPIDTSYYQCIQMPCKDYWCLVMKKDDVMTKYDVVTNHEIQNLKLAIAKRHQVKETLDRWMDNKKYQTVLNFDINYNMALLVESGLCYGISIDGVFDTGAYDHLTYRLLEPMIFSQSCLIWKKGLITNQALEKFIE